MTASPCRIVVGGLIAQYPIGGVTWDYVQYAAGLARLGHDVYYVEDSNQWPYNPAEDGIAKTCDYNVSYLAETMGRFGLEDRWAYRFPARSQWFGLPDAKRREVMRTADLVINISGTLAEPEQFTQHGRLVYVDSDPVFTQIKLALGQEHFRKHVNQHDVHFSFGEDLSCVIPSTGHNWRPTRQPILLSEWPTDSPHRNCFTTVMNWTSYNTVRYEGRTYGQKDVEFRRFLDLPGRVDSVTLEIAVAAGKTRQAPKELLAHKGWHLVDPRIVCPDLDTYREYIRSSMAEWSVAKNAYVVGRPGWFSCRSACYLAAGRPVAVQDTGFSTVLPTGEGVLIFSNVDEAAAAVHEIADNYERHSSAARALAEDHFDSRKVLGRLLEDAMSPTATIATKEGSR